jgi:hypothetical protein
MKLFNLFKKKSEPTDINEQGKKKKEVTKLSADYKYKVVMSDPVGSSKRDIGSFFCKKVRDIDGIVYLVNEEREFKEFYPLDEDTQSPYKEEFVIKKLNELDTRKQNCDIQKENPLNIDSEIYKWRKYLQAIRFNGGSFLFHDEQGNPAFNFLRIKSVFVPIKWNLNNITMYICDESNIKDVIKSNDDKYEKYMKKKQSRNELLQLIMWIIIVCFVGLNLFWTFKLMEYKDANAYAQIQNRIDMSPLLCAEMYGQAGNNFFNASLQANRFMQELKKNQNNLTTNQLNKLINIK